MMEKLKELEIKISQMGENVRKNALPILEQCNVQLERAKKVYDDLTTKYNNPDDDPYVKEFKSKLLDEVCDLSQILTLRKKALELEVEKFNTIETKYKQLIKGEIPITDEDVNNLEKSYNELISTIKTILINYISEEIGGN